MKFNLALAALAASNLVSAHPGEDHTKELEARRVFLSQNKRNLGHCANKLRARGQDDRIAAHRRELANAMIQKRSSDSQDSAWIQDNSFNSSCVLAPETTEGPYYLTGEDIRSNLTEGQAGIDLAFGVQFINVETCEPVIGAYVDAWSANATGVYSGVVNANNGDGLADLGNANATFLRGVQQTDSDGIVKFLTVFPGHYIGRTPHVHVLVHTNTTPTAEGTIIDTTASYVGQFYFNQSLIYSVYERSPYNLNTTPLTPNANDTWLQQDLELGGNPIIYIEQAAPDIAAGLYGWMSVGINVTAAYKVEPASNFTFGSPSP